MTINKGKGDYKFPPLGFGGTWISMRYNQETKGLLKKIAEDLETE